MAETIKCTCGHCGAKYRLPVEAQGRTAKCKRCGEKFTVPRELSLEDTVLTWLGTNDEDDLDESPVQPRIVSMPGRDEGEEESDNVRRMRGPIRRRENEPEEAPKAPTKK